MQNQIIDTILKFVLTGALGYLVSVVKNYKKKTGAINNALKIMLQNNLTNTYFVYSAKKKIPDYVLKNFMNMLEEYENLEGDDYIHTLFKKMESWEIVRTDILNN